MNNINTLDYLSILEEQTISRIKDNKPFNHLLKIYNTKLLRTILNRLEKSERYEDCLLIHQIITKRNQHLERFHDKSL